jgi:uncharacterized membrane protein HdeD (DUF308 family)
MASSHVGHSAAPRVQVTTPWWVALILGGTLTLVGVLILAAPQMTTGTLVRLLGVYWLVDGIVRLATIFVDRSDWGWNLVTGILGVLAGLAVLDHPVWATSFFAYSLVQITGILGVLIGVLELVMAFNGAGRGSAILGIAGIVVGVLLVVTPVADVVVVGIVTGCLAVVAGIAVTLTSFLLRPRT